MIESRSAASTLFQAAFSAYTGVDAALAEIAPSLSSEELAACKRAVGRVMGAILFEITEPVLSRHPELFPEAWKDGEPKGAQ